MAGSLGLATLESAFDPSGLRRGLDSARSHTEGWLSGWRTLWAATAGFIIAQVIGKIVSALAGMGRELVDAISGFQTLQIQLEGLVGGELFSGGGFSSFNEAVDAGIGRVSELIGWIKELAVSTPFTVQTLQRTLANAMAMGFTSKEAQGLTRSIGNFTAGMGLSQDVMERIIYNFGQMKAAGKVTGTELRDLARGGFVPIVDVLHRMQENMGLTNITFEEFREQASSGKIDVNEFFRAFQQMAGERFPNSMERMARTWQGVLGNMKDFLQSVFGAGVLGPAFDKITAGMADMLAALMNPGTQASFEALGRTLAGFINFDLDPEGFVKTLTANIDNLNQALQRFQVSGDWKQLLLDLHFSPETVDIIFKIGDGLKWVAENWQLIAAVLGALLAGNAIIGIVSGITAFVAALAAGAWIPLLIAAIVVALILLVVAFQQNFGGIRDKILEVWGIVQPVLKNIGDLLKAIFGDTLKSLMETAKAALAGFGENIKPVKDAFVTFEPVLKAAIGGIIGLILGLINGLITGLDWAIQFFVKIQEGVMIAVAGIMNVVTGFVTFFVNLFSGDMQGAWNSLVQFITGIAQIIGGILFAIINMFLMQLAWLAGIIWGFIEGVIAFFTNLKMVLVGGSIIPDMLNMILMVFQTVLNTVFNLVSSIFTRILAAITFVMNTAVKLVKAKLSLLINAFTNLMAQGEAVIIWIRTNFANAFEAAGKAVQKVIGFVQSLLKKLRELAKEMPDIIMPGSPTPFEMGIRGIGEAMQKLSQSAVPSLARSFDAQLNLSPSLSSSPDSLLGGLGIGAGNSNQYVFNMQKSDLNEDQLRRALQRAEALHG